MSKIIVAINSVNFGSTGNIMISIAEVARKQGYKYYVAYPDSRSNRKKEVRGSILIGTRLGHNLHSRFAYYTGLAGTGSIIDTAKFLRTLDRIHPDIIHLHNLHENYINLGMLFNYIKKNHIKVIWTLHDCWSFTGRCPHFQTTGCEKWRAGCNDCPYPKISYPSTKVDQSSRLWKCKKKWFTDVEDMSIVTPSAWLAGLVKQSFLNEYPVKVINNGIDLNIFKPTPSDVRRKILGV